MIIKKYVTLFVSWVPLIIANGNIEFTPKEYFSILSFKKHIVIEARVWAPYVCIDKSTISPTKNPNSIKYVLSYDVLYRMNKETYINGFNLPKRFIWLKINNWDNIITNDKTISLANSLFI